MGKVYEYKHAQVEYILRSYDGNSWSEQMFKVKADLNRAICLLPKTAVVIKVEVRVIKRTEYDIKSPPRRFYA